MALSGAFLIALGVSAFYIDVAVNFRYDFIEHHYDAFGMSILVGVVCAFVGCIGWAKLCIKQRRSLMAGLVFTAPWAGLLLGSPIGGINIHGPSAITMMLIIPSTLLAVVLLIMAALGPQEAR
jgi:hypothetical protein